MTPAVRWRGPLLGISGYAVEARLLVLELARRGVRVRAEAAPGTSRACPLPPGTDRQLRRLGTTPVAAPFVDVQHWFPDRWAGAPGAAARVGRTMFETDRIPAAWVAACNAVDEVWVPSRFNLETFAASGVAEHRLALVPSPVAAAPPASAGDGEGGAGAGGGGYRFLSVFDWTLRKGWDVLLRAYAAEFGPGDDVTLVLRIHSSYGLTGDDLRALVQRHLPPRAPAVAVLDGTWPDADMARLYRAADCLVLPTRGEGCGRPVVEAMAAGLPVIATAWSGPAEVLDPRWSYPLAVEALVPVPAAAVDEAPLFAGHRWAEPSADDLRRLLRHVYEHRGEAAAAGAAAREWVCGRYGVAAVGDVLVDRLERLA